jgi:hypothetical protein
LIIIFSGFIILGLYFGFSKTGKVTEVTLKNEETTSSIKTTTSTTKTTIKETTKKETTSTVETTTTTVLLGDPDCEELGCPYGANFVGSKNSDKYHYCSCSYAKSINRTNLVCFNNTEEAEEKGYTQSSCQPSSSTTSSTSTSSTSTPTSSIGSTIIMTTTPSTVTSTTTTAVPPSEHIVFSEVFYDPPGKESDEEWIELYNPTSNSIDLSGLKIQDNTKNYTIPDGTTILPGEFLVIARNETGFMNLFGFSPDVTGLTLNLNNDGDILTLRNGTVEIDMVSWGDYIPGWNLVVSENESIKREPPEQDTDTPSDWMSNAEPSPGL